MITRAAVLATLTTVVLITSCASTSSVVIPSASNAIPVAVLPLEGPLGEQAVDLLSQELARSGVAVVERARTRAVLGLDTDLSSSSPASVEALTSYGDQLGVTYLFAGTVSAQDGPLYSFPHVNMTLRLVDVRSGQTRWIGTYGNPLWTSAISQQGDLQRAARHLVREFVSAGGPELLSE